ncbi:MAG TPA: RNA-binding S4 domain-containing protein [Methylomirabilota bacterium]|nr:RNA-binding S4 domain-containing protein [Methylomirabilota bacterium]
MDKWLWAARLYKTRTLAAQACHLGRVRVAGQRVKPARQVRVGDLITAVTGDLTRTVRVIALVERRIGPAAVPQVLEDLTPASEHEAARVRAAERRLFHSRSEPWRRLRHRRREMALCEEPPAE